MTDLHEIKRARLEMYSWSPDGQQLIVTERTGGTDPSTVRYRVILVDLAQGFAAQIKEDVEAFGWMQSP